MFEAFAAQGVLKASAKLTRTGTVVSLSGRGGGCRCEGPYVSSSGRAPLQPGAAACGAVTSPPSLTRAHTPPPPPPPPPLCPPTQLNKIDRKKDERRVRDEMQAAVDFCRRCLGEEDFPCAALAL